MKIGMVIQNYPPVHYGGAINAHAVAIRLRRRGHIVKVITPHCVGVPFVPSDDERDVIRFGRAILVPANGSYSYGTIKFRLRHSLEQIIKSEQFDILHIHNPLEPTLSLLACDMPSVVKIGILHSVITSDRWFYLLKPLFQKRYDKLHGRIAVSQAAADYWEKIFGGGKSVIIPNGIDQSLFRPDLPKIEKFNTGLFHFLFVGRFEPRKGLHILLKAFERVAQKRPHARLIAIGSGGILEKRHRRLLSPDCQKKIFFEGEIANERLPSYYASANACCFPAIQHEAFGIVILEAWAGGKPIIASQIRGYGDLIDNERNGLLVPPKDAHALETAMIRLVDDAPLRSQLARNGLASASQYNWDRITEQTEQYYQTILSSTKA